MTAVGPMFELVLDRDAVVLGRHHRAAMPSLIFPLETSVIDLELAGGRTRLHRAMFAVIPTDARYRIESHSPAPKIVTLRVSAAARARAQREYTPHIDPPTFAAVLAAARVLPRTRWVDELVHRYVFEREICERHGSLATRFLETELTKELYFLGEEHHTGRSRTPVSGEGNELVDRARAAIEASLFEAFSMSKLARACHASASTLLRTFRRELGVTPGAYVRERRLDEAMQLLESGRYSVGEIAERVGYTGQAAFASAFHRKFHVPPSRVRQRSASPPLPPHGRPPKRARRGRT